MAASSDTMDAKSGLSSFMTDAWSGFGDFGSPDMNPLGGEEQGVAISFKGPDMDRFMAIEQTGFIDVKESPTTAPVESMGLAGSSRVQVLGGVNAPGPQPAEARQGYGGGGTACVVKVGC